MVCLCFLLFTCASECVCVSVCVFYMHSTSFTIFGHRAASSSLVPAMSVHISHSALRTAPCHTPSRLLPYSAVVTHAQRQFRFQFRMLSMRRGSAKKAKKRRRNATQKKNKQKLLAEFKQHFVVGPVLSVRGQPRTP